MRGFDVLNWSGPSFMLLFFGLCLGSGMLARVVRWSACSKRADVLSSSLEPEHVAWLEGGAYRIAQSAFSRLLHLGYLRASPENPLLLQPGLAVNHNAGPQDRLLVQALSGQPISTALATVQKHLQATTDRVAQQLSAWGLRLGPADALSFRWNPTLVALVPLLIGVPKLVVGLSRDRPVAFLMIAMLVWLAIVYGKFVRAPYPITREATRMLKTLRKQASVMKTQATRRVDGLSGRDIAMLVGLFGISSIALAQAPYADVLSGLQERRPPGSDGSGSSSDSSCSSSDGDGDGGGGGGCGGCGGGGGGD